MTKQEIYKAIDERFESNVEFCKVAGVKHSQNFKKHVDKIEADIVKLENNLKPLGKTLKIEDDEKP